jgi:Ca-activated chloride channel family protein
VSALVALLLLAMPQTNLEAKIEVAILQPSTLQAAFGDVDVEAQVHADRKILEVELFVDDRSRGLLDGPPYRWRVDVGQENVEHRFRVEARGELGTTGTSTIVTPRIRVDEEVNVQLQQLYVTVTRSDSRVLDLSEHDFRVFDNGRREPLVTFARGDVPLTAVLLVDSSVSMKGERLASGLRGAEAFVASMKPLDEAMLLLFSDQILHATAFTQQTDALLEPLAGLEADGNTAINDHVYLALKLLDARQGRRVVVLFTDGADLHSVLGMEEVLWKARRSQALIYWLRLDEGGSRYTSFATAWRDAPANRAELERLEESVIQSGGRIATLTSVNAIEPAFREILLELREQYVLGFYPSSVRNDGSWHHVNVRVERSGMKVRARGGYVDF